MRYGSVCSGIEAASAAWHGLGWHPAWFAEIEAFPSAVLAHRYPDVPNLGDMTQIAGAIEAEAVEAPDILVGGTPCQAFSVAGLRMSLADARGNLTLSFVELANAIDNLRRHRGQPAGIIVWENVPGVLNTRDNAFGCFLGGMAGCDTPLIHPHGQGWPDAGVVLGPQRAVAWRVLDAQFFGVAQRRRRVFVVASARDGLDPAAVLFEWEGVRRDSAPSREPGKGTAAGTLRSTDGGSDVDHGRAGHLITMAHGQGGAEIGIGRAPTLTCNHEAPIEFLSGTAHTLRAEGFDASEDGTGRGTPLVPVSVALRGRDGGAACEVGDDVAFTLRASSGGGDKPHVMAPVAFTCKDHGADAGELSPTLRAVGHAGSHANAGGQVAVAFPANLSGTQCASTENISPSLGAKNPTAFAAAMQVRRLTPRECERLQGFPDDYTLIPWKSHQAWAKRKGTMGPGESFDEFLRRTTGRGLREPTTEDCPDGPRYKALGNSMAVPVMRWIGARIARQVKQ